MKTVLVTGGIGTGKSEVCRYLESKGFPVYDSDSRTKALYDSVEGLKEKIEKELGIPFAELKTIFTDTALKEKLQNIVYPLVREDFLKWRASYEGKVAFVVMESALASANEHFRDLFDSVVLVTAPEFIRIRRVMERSGLSKEEVLERIMIQNPFTPHNYQIPNMTDLDSLHTRIDELINKLI